MAVAAVEGEQAAVVFGVVSLSLSRSQSRSRSRSQSWVAQGVAVAVVSGEVAAAGERGQPHPSHLTSLLADTSGGNRQSSGASFRALVNREEGQSKRSGRRGEGKRTLFSGP